MIDAAKAKKARLERLSKAFDALHENEPGARNAARFDGAQLLMAGACAGGRVREEDIIFVKTLCERSENVYDLDGSEVYCFASKDWLYFKSNNMCLYRARLDDVTIPSVGHLAILKGGDPE